MIRCAVLLIAFAACSGDEPAPAAVPSTPAAPAVSAPARRTSGTVAIAGTVRVLGSRDPAVGVEVVFRGPRGEITTRATSLGAYRIAVPPGSYRVVVRDDRYVSIAPPDRVRVPEMPNGLIAGVPDESLMPIIDATDDVEGVDLAVVRAGGVTGHVFDRQGRALTGAVVRARGQLRPALGTDVAVTDAHGQFALRLAPGDYLLEATHAKHAGLNEPVRISVLAAHVEARNLTLSAGCIIEGRVIDRRGEPTGDGAIEKDLGGFNDFGPGANIRSDGTFRVTTTEDGEVKLRAWPWKMAPSRPRAFACRDGARFPNVVFEVPDDTPGLDGILLDATGAPMPFTYIDMMPLDPITTPQQERTDAFGRWAIYEVPAGRYVLRAQVPNAGVVSTEVNAPGTGLELKLGGVGRLEGTTTFLSHGAFELVATKCEGVGNGAIAIPQQRRLVTVRGGRFRVDNLPVCRFVGSATWRDQRVPLTVEIPAGGMGVVELALGEPRKKLVRGIVRDEHRKPVPEALVTATAIGGHDVVVKADQAGRFEVDTFAGATLTTGVRGRAARGTVGMANVEIERVDLVLGTLIE